MNFKLFSFYSSPDLRTSNWSLVKLPNSRRRHSLVHAKWVNFEGDFLGWQFWREDFG
jgi:hypothetical protein